MRLAELFKPERWLERSFSPQVRRQITRAAIGLAFVLVALWGAHIGTVVYLPQAEWYPAAEKFIRSSPEISAEVGRITQLTPIAGGASWLYSSSDWKDAQSKVQVTGSRGSAVVWIRLIKVSGVWKPTAAALNDENGRKLKLQ